MCESKQHSANHCMGTLNTASEFKKVSEPALLEATLWLSCICLRINGKQQISVYNIFSWEFMDKEYC